MALSLLDNLFIIASLFANGILEMLIVALGAFSIAGDAVIGTGIAVVGILQNVFDFIPTPLFTLGF